MIQLNLHKINKTIIKFSFHQEDYSLLINNFIKIYTSVNSRNFSKYYYSVSNLSALFNV